MLKHLKQSNNKITIERDITDRDGDISSTFLIGSGYGLFRTKTIEELSIQSSEGCTWVGILGFFEPDTSKIEPENNTENGDDANGESVIIEIPDADKVIKSGDIATWRNKEYYIASVVERVDIHGEFIGYWLECGQGRAGRM